VSRLRYLSSTFLSKAMPDFSFFRLGKKRTFIRSTSHRLRRLTVPEQLEERSVLNASDLFNDARLGLEQDPLAIDPVFAPGTPPEIVARYEADANTSVGFENTSACH
jgi:hypothetical protein